MAETALPHLPDDASMARRIVTGFQALMVLRDDAGNPQAGALVNRCFDYEVYQAHIARIQATPAGEQLLELRPSLQRGDLDLEALGRLGKGTLGRELVEYFERNGFPPFDTDQPIDTDMDYISKRYRETHDSYHVITGYSTDDLGEMELQAFVMGNLGIRSPRLICSFGYVVVGLWQHAMLPPKYLRLLRAAFERGRAAKPFLEFPFEEHWSTPVEQVQAMLEVAPAKA